MSFYTPTRHGPETPLTPEVAHCIRRSCHLLNRQAGGSLVLTASWEVVCQVTSVTMTVTVIYDAAVSDKQLPVA